MEEDRAERLSSQFYLYEVLEQATLISGGKKSHQWLLLGLWGQGLSGKGHEGTFWGIGNILYLERGLSYTIFLHL